MKKILLITLMMISLGLVSCTSGDGTTPGDEAVVKTVNVKTKLIEASEFTSFLRVVGVVETSDDIRISAEVNGRVVRHSVDEGDRIKKGQVLVQIDDSKLRQEKARLEALNSQAKENYERVNRLYEEDGIGSEIAVLNARYDYEQSLSALESIKVDLDNTSIKAPFDGVVESYFVEIGEMAGVGMPVARLIGTNSFKVTAGVPARYSNVIRTGDRMKVWFDMQESDTLDAQISFVGNSIDPQNRTFEIEGLLPGRNDFYKVDMIGNIRLTTLQRDNVITISEEFVYNENGQYVTYVLAEDEDGNPVSEQRVIELGPSYRSKVIITNGLSIGEKLITTGSAFLNDKTRVKVVEEAMASRQ